MSDIGLFFASSTGNCQTIAHLIAKEFSPYKVEIFDVMHTDGQKMLDYRNLIFGIPTWDKHELHIDWKNFLPTIYPSCLENKRIALFGSGDQRIFSDNFANGMGLLYAWFIGHNADVVGFWPATGYKFRSSLALRNGEFIGLVLDEDVQSHLTPKRVKGWVNNLKQEFYL